MLLKTNGTTVQISMPQEIGAAMAQKAAPGKRLRVFATADHSPKTADGAHPVGRPRIFLTLAVDLGGAGGRSNAP